MSLPNFLGIGAMRSGTTWLDRILRTHPQIYLPERRKEIQFFSANFERGFCWYEKFFPPAPEAGKHKWIGEITPGYLYNEDTPARIHSFLPSCRFIGILRNPADRAYSHYGFSVRNVNERRPFHEYLRYYPGIFARGLYGEQVKRYLKYFKKENFLFLIFEESTAKPKAAIKKIADFFNLNSEDFQVDERVREKVNSSYLPRFGRLYFLTRILSKSLRKMDFDWLVNLGKTLEVQRFSGFKGTLPPLEHTMRSMLIEKYEPDIALLEDLLDQDLVIWRRGKVV
ncbi:sulfotransferase domain-containing protein [Thermodesulfobacteriota bacterium]